VSASHIAAAVLLWTGVAAEVICVAGVLWFRDAFDGLHFAAAATTIGPVLIAIATALTGFSSASGTLDCISACVVLVLLNPMLTSATGRAARDPQSSLAAETPPEQT
jgi:multisubunit Na+/H+ antiporter MnhG subunit